MAALIHRRENSHHFILHFENFSTRKTYVKPSSIIKTMEWDEGSVGAYLICPHLYIQRMWWVGTFPSFDAIWMTFKSNLDTLCLLNQLLTGCNLWEELCKTKLSI